MEITCNRCHQTVPPDSCYCPNCGLPQLVYSTEENGEAAAQPDRWSQVAYDASAVEWKPALRAAILLAVPAGLLSSEVSPLGPLGIFWITAAGGWAVSLYIRKQRNAWITTGAGARIGLVTGILAAWLMFVANGAGLFTERFVLHRGAQIDQLWETQVNMGLELTQKMMAQFGTMDKGQVDWQRRLELSPQGHAGFVLAGLLSSCIFLMAFASISGAISARLMARARRPRA